MPLNTKDPLQPPRIRPRWPIALSVIVVLFLLALLPDRVRLFPAWFAYAISFAALGSMLALSLMGANARWRRIEHTVVLLFFGIVGVANLTTLMYLVREMVHGSMELNGLRLLSSSIGVWVINILAFAMLYWQIDRDGPEARLNNRGKRPDWLFPQTGAPDDAPLDWRPTFIKPYR